MVERKRLMLEKYLIEHCAPTLAGLKIGSLFACKYKNKEEFEDNIERLGEMLEVKKLKFKVMSRNEQRALVYVYRPNMLEKSIREQNVENFLKIYGYSEFNLDKILFRLEERINQSAGFPHEIGIFLGYPLNDVVGFINNNGKKSKCAGYWKVYCNEDEAVRIFKRYSRCREIYEKLWKNGKSVIQLTVAV